MQNKHEGITARSAGTPNAFHTDYNNNSDLTSSIKQMSVWTFLRHYSQHEQSLKFSLNVHNEVGGIDCPNDQHRIAKHVGLQCQSTSANIAVAD